MFLVLHVQGINEVGVTSNGNFLAQNYGTMLVLVSS
jgi:hypothetical protein